MLHFDLYNPTKLIFGKGQIARLSSEIALNHKILLIYGGGSIKQNGIYNQVKQALAKHDVVEFGGVTANPEYETLLQALTLIREQNITFLLAVGGGSVIDGTKFLASANLHGGDDPWQILATGFRTELGLPFGSVLTLPGTGSEMNSSAVISRKAMGEKRAMGGPGLFPKFSILDPEVVHSIPKRQLQNGLADSFTHVLEQYMTYPTGADLQDRFSESILNSIIATAPKILSNPSNYIFASNYMWCCTMALNGLIQKGVPSDWSIHMMGHELTALYGIDHARTLAILTPQTYRFCFEAKKDKLAQCAERVFNIQNGTLEEKAKRAIDALEEFFNSLDMPSQLSKYVDQYEGTAEKIASIFEQRNWKMLGERKNIGPKEVERIVKMSY